MKWLIASDIHGSEYYCQKMFEAFEKEKCDRILLLGDLLYHGPRNDLPREYAPKKVIALLSEHAQDILCVRGNCEAEVDQMVLPFPVMADYAILSADTQIIFATHGHLYNEEKLPPFHKGDILLHGHTHVPVLRVKEDYIYMNPGSVAIPKEDSWHGYMTMEDGVFLWKDFEGNEHMRYQMK